MEPNFPGVDHDQALLTEIIRTLVDLPDQVVVTSEPVIGNQLTFMVLVEGHDMGHVIGTGGRTARALRTLMYAVGAKRKRVYVLNIVRHLRPAEAR